MRTMIHARRCGVGRNLDRWPRTGLGSALAASSSTGALRCPCVSQIRVLCDDGDSAEPCTSSCRGLHLLGQGDAKFDQKVASRAARVRRVQARESALNCNLGENPCRCWADAWNRGCWHRQDPEPHMGPQGAIPGQRGAKASFCFRCLLNSVCVGRWLSKPIHDSSILQSALFSMPNSRPKTVKAPSTFRMSYAAFPRTLSGGGTS